MQMSKAASDKAILMAAFARMDTVALAVAMGTILALVLYLATAVLLIRGGDDVGPHLALLGIYLPGYEVSWVGGLIGAAYFWLIGAVLGFAIAFLWNMTHYMFVALVVVRTMWWRMMAD
jgi:hypothetical protein